MKRFISAAAALILLMTACGIVNAQSISDDVPPPFEFLGFEDIGETRAVLFDVDSGAVIFENNSDSRAVPGSLTVIMTALILIENTDPASWDEPLPELSATGTGWSARGSRMGLQKGDTPTRRDLLYGLLLMGASDAAFVTEELISGGETGFVEIMNQKANELAMTDTNFVNGYGLGTSGHYTTASDMVLLTLSAMKHEIFSEAVQNTTYTCSKGCRGIELTNSNSALGSSGCIGIKSGEDSEKAHCVIVGREEGSARLAAVVLEAQSESAAYGIADRLISFGFTNYLFECGLRSYTPTNAFVKTISNTSLYAEPDTEPLSSVSAGEKLRVCGAHTSMSGIWLCVYDGSAFEWIKASDTELICYVDDIFIFNGDSLSREITKGDRIEIDALVSSRHEIRNVTLTLKLPDGTQTLKTSAAPMSHGKCELSSSKLGEPFSNLIIPEGLYICTLEIEAMAYMPGFDPKTIVKSETSLLAVGTGGECVCYNANTGSGASEGECFFDSFVIPVSVPHKAGFVFDRWNTSPDGTGESYFIGDTVAKDSSLTLYAMWKKGAYNWEPNCVISYEDGLIIEGFIKNDAGVTSVNARISEGSNLVCELSSDCCENEVSIGELLINEPVRLSPGTYSVDIFASANGNDAEKLLSQTITVDDAAVTIPAETSSPAASESNEPQPEPAPAGFAGIPIWVLFLIGTVVVAGLITWIVIILKKG